MKEQDLRENILDAIIEDGGNAYKSTDKCLQITLDYAREENKELINCLKDLLDSTTKEFADLNGFGKQRKKAKKLLQNIFNN